ncbi:hypothetical protein ACLD9W_07250 [Neisseria sp. WLZKY-1]
MQARKSGSNRFSAGCGKRPSETLSDRVSDGLFADATPFFRRPVV